MTAGHPRHIATAFEAYLEKAYRARAKLLPPAQRAELEQAFHGGAQATLQTFAGLYIKNARPETIEQAIIDRSAELDAYGLVRATMIDIATGKFARGGKQG